MYDVPNLYPVTFPLSLQDNIVIRTGQEKGQTKIFSQNFRVNTIASSIAKTPLSFDHSERNRVNKSISS